METYKIMEKLRNMYNILCDGEGGVIEIEYFNHAADRLEELENENEFLKNARVNLMKECVNLRKQLSEQQPEWISVKDGKEMPDVMSYTGIRHDQFPRLVVAIDENSHVTHWMMLDAPNPKEPTFKDVFLKAFPKTCNVCFMDFCPKTFFESIKCPLPVVCSEKTIEACWNQPCFEEEEGEADA